MVGAQSINYTELNQGALYTRFYATATAGVGGDVITMTIRVPYYAFLISGWAYQNTGSDNTVQLSFGVDGAGAYAPRLTCATTVYQSFDMGSKSEEKLLVGREHYFQLIGTIADTKVLTSMVLVRKLMPSEMASLGLR